MLEEMAEGFSGTIAHIRVLVRCGWHAIATQVDAYEHPNSHHNTIPNKVHNSICANSQWFLVLLQLFLLLSRTFGWIADMVSDLQ